jgi:hypothetical protein
MKTFLASLLTVILFSSTSLAYDLIIDFPGRFELDLDRTHGSQARVLIRTEYRPDGHVWVTPDQKLHCQVMFYDQLGEFDQMTIHWQSYKPEGRCELSWWTITGWHINLTLVK